MATCLTPPLKVTVLFSAGILRERLRVDSIENTVSLPVRRKQDVDIYANKSSEANKCSGGEVEESWKTF